MILKIEYYEKGQEGNPHVNHIRVIDVYDFHIDKPQDQKEVCSHELVYHTEDERTGRVLLGSDKNNPDHVYIMKGGKTIDHMKFYAN